MSIDVKLELMNCEKIYYQLVKDYKKVINEVENMKFGNAIDTCYETLQLYNKCGGDNQFYGNFPWASINRQHKMLMYDITDVISVLVGPE